MTDRVILLLLLLLLSGLRPFPSRAGQIPQSAPNAAVGPSFICGPGQEPLAQMICGDRGFSRLDLQFGQAYEALRQQSAAEQQRALWLEQLSFHTAVLQFCSIPTSGDLPPAPGTIACAEQAYEKQRQQWLSRLSGAALEEANRAPEVHIAAQRALQSKGYLPASAQIDGVYGPATRAAILAFQQNSSLPPSGLLGDRDVALLIGNAAPGRAGEGSSALDVDALPQVPPIATATYAGRPALLVHGDLAISMDREVSSNSSLCIASAQCKVLLVRLKQGGQQVLSIAGQEMEDGDINLAAATIELRTLDRASSEPAVVFSFYSSGTHCCYDTKIAVYTSDNSWEILDAGELDAGRFEFVDLLRDSEMEFVHKDDRFDYAFGCYACSAAPMQVYHLVGANLVDVSAAPAFRDYQLAALRRMEKSPAFSLDIQPLGYLAGWVAQKALVGQLTDGWSTMLARYDHSETDGLQVCSLELSIDKCPPSSNSTVDFPTALALFLVRTGYISQADSAQLWYDTASIEARIQAPVTGWYNYLRSGECAPATAWKSPADLISFDRENGVEDVFDVVKADSDGKPIMVRVTEPRAGDMVSIYTFFRGVDACNDYRQQQKQELQNLR